MGTNRFARCRLRGIFNRQDQSPYQGPEVRSSEDDLPGNRRAFSLPTCATLILTALFILGLGIAPSMAEVCDDPCLPCHGSLEAVHGDFDHAATPGSGPVALFADNAHDDAGWVGEKPYFDVFVNCTVCHSNDLPLVHGNDCATCHPTPYDTLGIWGKGCQQGGCHAFYHQDATLAHLPWDNAINDPDNDCTLCHNQYWGVTDVACRNCHDAYVPGDLTPPETTTDALTEYVGPGRIGFSIKDNGKVGVGRTFYQLDGGPEIAAGKNLFITDDIPGQHELKFWSKDQYGNTEAAPNVVNFNIVEDTTPPTTNSNAQASYNQGAVITLTATDASTLGVKNTYYRLNGGATNVGTTVAVPATSGTVDYTLTFWSDDWAGNAESPKNVNFTVTSGGGTLKLVWGDSDASGSPCSGDPEAAASWTIRRGTTTVATGSGQCPNWDGVDDISVPISPTIYYVIIDWYDSYSEDWDQSSFGVYVKTPGQNVRIAY